MRQRSHSALANSHEFQDAPRPLPYYNEPPRHGTATDASMRSNMCQRTGYDAPHSRDGQTVRTEMPQTSLRRECCCACMLQMCPPRYSRSLLHRGRGRISRTIHTPDNTRGGPKELPRHLPRRHRSDEYNPTIPETQRTRIVASDLDPGGRTKICGTVLIDSSGKVGIVVTRVPVPPSGTIRAYVRMVGAIATTKVRVPAADIWDCLLYTSDAADE